jgi:flagellar basal-body rod protein FlgF
MIRGLYSAATGIEGATRSQEVAAENLANANVPGYRRVGLAFETFDQALGTAQAASGSTGGSDSLLGVRPAEVFTVFEPGAVQQTGDPLDVVATGNAFFVVDGPNGPLLTRNGTFTLNAQNQLQTAGGMTIRGQGGAIVIPPDTINIAINLEGVVYADGAQVDRLQIAQVPNPETLERAGTTVFQGPLPRSEPEPGSIRIEQGYREASNVQVVGEMIALLSSLRLLEASDRALRSLSDITSLVTRPQT